MFFRFAGADVHTPRLIGAFVLFAALLMFVGSVAEMFNSWDNLKYWEECLLEADDDVARYQDCRADLYNNTGIYMHYGEAKLSTRQTATLLLSPIAGIFLWLAILFIGWMLYKTGDLVLPIEETVRDVERKKKRKRK